MKTDHAKLSAATLSRLPTYCHALRELLLENRSRATSAELAARTSLSVALVRSDLRWFAGSGQRGYGYQVRSLYTEISALLGVGDGYRAVCIGRSEGATEMLGRMLGRCGVSLIGFLSEDTASGEAVRATGARIGILLPCCHDPLRACLALREGGVRGVVNYTDLPLSPEGITVRNDPLSDTVLMLCGEMRRKDEQI